MVQATIAALVLGLLIGGAKGSFDTRSNQVKQLTANVILLDNLLAQYGAEATPLRKGLRGAINPIVDRLWHEKITTEPFTADIEGEKLYLAKADIRFPGERAYSGARALRNGISEIIIRPLNGSFSSKIK